MRLGKRMIGCVLGALGLLAVAARGPGAGPEGGSYYTLSNLWYERGATIDTVYHSGEIIPMASRVKIELMRDSRIVFSTEDGGSFTMSISSYDRKSVSLDAMFAQYFSDRDPLAPESPFHALSRLEQRNIADGTLAVGMSKAAVIMAYGYPPSHRTPSTAESTWRYWRKKMRDFTVSFDGNGRVESLDRY